MKRILAATLLSLSFMTAACTTTVAVRPPRAGMVLVEGRWVMPPRPRAVWIPGHWQRRGVFYRVWVPGQWREE